LEVRSQQREESLERQLPRPLEVSLGRARAAFRALGEEVSLVLRHLLPQDYLEVPQSLLLELQQVEAQCSTKLQEECSETRQPPQILGPLCLAQSRLALELQVAMLAALAEAGQLEEGFKLNNKALL